jgi:hypothetical protein
MWLKTKTLILSHCFCGSGIWKHLWVVLAQGPSGAIVMMLAGLWLFEELTCCFQEDSLTWLDTLFITTWISP